MGNDHSDREWCDHLVRSILDPSEKPDLPQGRSGPYPYELFVEDFYEYVRRNGLPKRWVRDLGREGWGEEWTDTGLLLQPLAVGWQVKSFERGWHEPGEFYATRDEAERAIVRGILGGTSGFFGLPRPRPGDPE